MRYCLYISCGQWPMGSQDGYDVECVCCRQCLSVVGVIVTAGFLPKNVIFSIVYFTRSHRRPFRKLLDCRVARYRRRYHFSTKEEETVQNLYLIYQGLAVVLVGRSCRRPLRRKTTLSVKWVSPLSPATAASKAAAPSRCVVARTTDLTRH